MERDLREKIFKKTEGILSTVVGIALWELFYLTEFGTSFSQRGAWTANLRADRWLEEINYGSLKNAWKRARKQGLVLFRGKTKRAIPKITEEGKKRLRALIPHYDEKRFWDGRLYLVTYDIPETKKKDRELLREYLRRIGAGMVQESVWLNPYDPRETLKEFLDTNYLHGLVLIPVLEKDSSIGEEDLESLIKRIYKLESLNERYQDFIENFSSGKHQFSEVYFSFLSILKDDPQLPFPLLSSDWLGDKAYELFRRLTNKREP